MLYVCMFSWSVYGFFYVYVLLVVFCGYILSLFFFWPRLAACGILVPRPGIEPGSTAVKAQSPNHWITREFPVGIYYRLLYKFYGHMCFVYVYVYACEGMYVLCVCCVYHMCCGYVFLCGVFCVLRGCVHCAGVYVV